MIKYGLLTADDEMASEHEVYDFLYALVRLLKPKVILETGTYKGGATKAMARAAKENGVGYVYSCETNWDLGNEVNAQLDSDGLPAHSSYCSGEEECSNLMNVDFAFIDSSSDRVAEVAALNLAPNGVVVLHDAKRPQYQAIKTMRPWKAIWEIDTVQGITVFQS